MSNEFYRLVYTFDDKTNSDIKELVSNLSKELNIDCTNPNEYFAGYASIPHATIFSKIFCSKETAKEKLLQIEKENIISKNIEICGLTTVIVNNIMHIGLRIQEFGEIKNCREELSNTLRLPVVPPKLIHKFWHISLLESPIGTINFNNIDLEKFTDYKTVGKVSFANPDELNKGRVPSII